MHKLQCPRGPFINFFEKFFTMLKNIQVPVPQFIMFSDGAFPPPLQTQLKSLVIEALQTFTHTFSV